MSAHKKLMEARLTLQSTKLKKSGHNKFAGYNYFELGDFLPAVQQIFEGVGLCGVVSFGTDLATLTITDIDDGSSISITSPMSSAALKGCHEVQNLGAVQTYIRRYLWVTAMEIVEHDALDAVTGSDAASTHKNTPKTDKVTPMKHTPAQGAFDALDATEKAQVQSRHDFILDAAAVGEWDEAFAKYDEVQGEQRVALFELLGKESAIRTKLKKMTEERKAA